MAPTKDHPGRQEPVNDKRLRGVPLLAVPGTHSTTNLSSTDMSDPGRCDATTMPVHTMT